MSRTGQDRGGGIFGFPLMQGYSKTIACFSGEARV